MSHGPEQMLALATRGLQPDYNAAIDAYRSLTRFAGLGVWLRSVIARDEEQRAQATKIANEPFDSQERQALVGEIESKLGDLFPEQFRPNTKTGMASWAMLELIMRELLEQTAKFGDGPITVAPLDAADSQAPAPPVTSARSKRPTRRKAKKRGR